MDKKHSLTALFHMAGDEETGSNVVDMYKLHQIAEDQERKKVVGDTVKHLEEILADIGSIRLKKEDTKQQVILNKQKDTSRELLNGVIESAKTYLETVMSTENYKQGREHLEQQDYLEGLKKMDIMREQKHNLLIDAINIANRYISLHFSKLKTDDLDAFIEDEENKGRATIDVQRIILPISGICTAGINLRDRKSIANWARVLSSELSDYKKINGRDYALPLEGGDGGQRA
ncbi:MAG: DUF3232 domain-containing protein [Candidatus Magasanikbacteria bacterium]|nr:DUF3232 domain-containing protein [Candidatus Magasanikbacteria bacterium]